MKVQTFTIEGKKSCNTCRGSSGASAIVLDKPVSDDLLQKIMATGQYVEAKHMTQAGILYVEDKMLTIHGGFGKNRLSIKCKFSLFGKIQECNQALDAVVEMLKAIE